MTGLFPRISLTDLYQTYFIYPIKAFDSNVLFSAAPVDEYRYSDAEHCTNPWADHPIHVPPLR